MCLIPDVLLVLLGHEAPDYVLISLLALQETQKQPFTLIIGQVGVVNILVLDAGAASGGS